MKSILVEIEEDALGDVVRHLKMVSCLPEQATIADSLAVQICRGIEAGAESIKLVKRRKEGE